ncbi:MAG: Aspartate racemase [Firmicutes bacterium]|nr:Aspartate racemase [candidate division NPL-UPA2 bacterium]
MRVIGILGGMGPQATLDLYQKVLQFTPATRDQDHLQVLIWSDPHIPDRTAAILYGGEDPSYALCAGSARLVKGGAECIGIPCNTAHYYLDAIRREAAGVPVLDMIELTARSARTQLDADAVVAITATRATLATGLYNKALTVHGLKAMVPSLAEQEIIDDIIFGPRGVKAMVPSLAEQEIIDDLIFGPRGVKAGFVDENNCRRFQAVCSRLFSSGAEAVLAACTELPLLAHPASSVLPIIDPTSVLAQALVSFGLEDTAAGRGG